MSRSRIATTIAAAGLGIALLGACSAESLSERAVGFGMEQALEAQAGEDVDLDFDLSNGSFNISTEEGDFALNLDGENGGILFDTPDGEGAISFDENGIVFDTDGGDGRVDFGEGGITFDTDEGSGSIDFDENGVVFTDEDGSTSSFGATTAPEDWPAVIGFPSTYVEADSSFTTLGWDELTSHTGAFTHSPDEDFAGAVGGRLQAAGFNVESTTADGLEVVYKQGADNTAHVATTGSGFTHVTVTFGTLG